MSKRKTFQKLNLDYMENVVSVTGMYGGYFIRNEKCPKESTIVKDIDDEYDSQFENFVRAGVTIGAGMLFGLVTGVGTTASGYGLSGFLSGLAFGTAGGTVVSLFRGGISGILHMIKKNQLIEFLEQKGWTVIKPGFSLSEGDSYGAVAYKDEEEGKIK